MSDPLKEMTGVVCGRLTVIQRAGRASTGKVTWLCRCLCGKETVVSGNDLRRGRTVSCGCYRAIKQNELRTTHAGSDTPEYNSWQGIIRRTTNTNDKAWDNYGGRGITVCERWRHSFENFLEDMGRKPSPTHSIDRIDNDLLVDSYSKKNCRWATPVEQSNNRRVTRKK